MVELVVADHTINSGRGKHILARFGCQENIAESAKDAPHLGKVISL
jgi:hypothetical protein